MIWSGEFFKCRGCGEIYPYRTSLCPCCGEVCVRTGSFVREDFSDWFPSDGDTPNTPTSLASLEKSILNYRTMLAQSAQRCKNENAERADWMRAAQGALRDLTKDMKCASEELLAKFFSDVRAYIESEHSNSDDFFVERVRLVELRNGLPKTGGAAWRALKESIY